jgi:hypothetical protein
LRSALLIAAVLVVACNEAEPGPEADDDGSSGEAAGTTDTEGDTDGGTDDGDTDAETEGEPLTCDEAPVITYDTFGRGFLATYCNGCHGGQVVDRQGAPENVIFDDADRASAFSERILSRVLPDTGVPPMPPNGGVVVDDIDRLVVWLQCYP